MELDLKSPYFTKQIITYLGNKRSLLSSINHFVESVKKDLNQEKISTADLFSGSGIVARLLKEHSFCVSTNDLEDYSYIINRAFLTNHEDFSIDEYNKVLEKILYQIKVSPINGIISKNYAPINNDDIKKEERVFYTTENAVFIDSFRSYLEAYKQTNPTIFNILLAQLITQASIHSNTSGVFKGFYKDKNSGIGKFGGTAENALKRIKKNIKIDPPYFSNNSCKCVFYKKDAIKLSETLPYTDLVYLDPPYNQHPYGSNYFMLNLIVKNKKPKTTSKVSGIPTNWNHSPFNVRANALISMEHIIRNLKAKYVLISYNNEGFISFGDMTMMLKKYGRLEMKEIKYNTFRGSRNLNGRDIHTKEYLFLLKKEE